MTVLRVVRMTHDLKQPYGEWLRDHDLSAKTITQRLEFFSRLVVQIDPATATTGDLSLWLSQYEGWTRLTYLASLRSIGKFLVEAGVRDDNPAAGLRRGPNPDMDPRPFNADEEARILAAAAHRRHHGAWFLLGLRAGFRAHEAAKLDGQDVTRERVRVLGKGGKVCFIPTHPDIWDLAQHYPRSGPWFPSYRAAGHITGNYLSGRTSALLASVGLDGSFHRLRATYATSLLRAGVNIRVVQKLMRHESLNTTEHYLGVADDELTSAIATLGAPAERLAA